jgi:PAB1-binding protein PBP1
LAFLAQQQRIAQLSSAPLVFNASSISGGPPKPSSNNPPPSIIASSATGKKQQQQQQQPQKKQQPQKEKTQVGGGGGVTPQKGLLEEGDAKGWDVFEANKRLFGVDIPSELTKEEKIMYGLRDINSSDFSKEQLAAADALAKEMRDGADGAVGQACGEEEE